MEENIKCYHRWVKRNDIPDIRKQFKTENTDVYDLVSFVLECELCGKEERIQYLETSLN